VELSFFLVEHKHGLQGGPWESSSLSFTQSGIPPSVSHSGSRPRIPCHRHERPAEAGSGVARRGQERAGNGPQKLCQCAARRAANGGFKRPPERSLCLARERVGGRKRDEL
jgi:hypothetical protein